MNKAQVENLTGLVGALYNTLIQEHPASKKRWFITDQPYNYPSHYTTKDSAFSVSPEAPAEAKRLAKRASRLCQGYRAAAKELNRLHDESEKSWRRSVEHLEKAKARKKAHIELEALRSGSAKGTFDKLVEEIKLAAELQKVTLDV